MVTIRPADAADRDAIETLYPHAFPDEDLLPLLRDLTGLAGVLAFVAVHDDDVVGHIAFTICGSDQRPADVAMLAPLAVAPHLHRKGIGTALVREGLRHLPASVRQVNVLGDPAYYGRFGFRPDRNLQTPYSLPAEWADAWQVLVLQEGVDPLHGVLRVPPPWRHRALWSE